MSARPRICATLGFQTCKLLARGASVAASQGADMLELRIDHLQELPRKCDLTWVEKVELPVITTLRRESDGGRYRASEKQRLECLSDLASASGWVDLELDSATPDVVDRLREEGTKLIVSHHDLRHTPPVEELVSILMRERAAGADMCKLATMAKSRRDVLDLLSLLRHPHPMVIVSMGAKGTAGRILAPLLGSEFAYATLDGLPPVAPGMLSISQMKNAYEQLVELLPGGVDP